MSYAPLQCYRINQTNIIETELTLEELDQVFSVPTWKHASYQIKNAVWHVRTWVFRQKLEPLAPFYQGAEKLNES